MKKYTSVLLAIGALMHPIVSEAARTAPPTWWFNLGMGTGTNFGNSDVSLPSGAGVEFSFNGTLSEHSLLTLYTAGFSKGASGYSAKHQGDFGVMYGYVSRKPSSYWSASAGLCYYYAEKETTYYPDYYFDRYTVNHKFKGAGIPLEVQTFWAPFNHFGIGFVGHAVASQRPSTTAMLAIQVF